MKLIKKNKFMIVVICVVLIILLTSFYSIVRLLFPNLGAPVYGNRLENIENRIISTDKQKEIVGNLKLNDIVADANIDIRGLLINIMVDVKDGTDVTIAKNIGAKVLNEFSNEKKEFYDIQIFITKEADEENTLYPIIGYKNKLSPNFVWTNN